VLVKLSWLFQTNYRKNVLEPEGGGRESAKAPLSLTITAGTGASAQIVKRIPAYEIQKVTRLSRALQIVLAKIGYLVLIIARLEFAGLKQKRGI
jgi:hypothetical protein